MNSYDQGTRVRIAAVFTNTSNVATDPGAVTYGVLKPDGTTITGSASKDSTGNYHGIIDTSAGPGGVWAYRLSGTDPLQAVGDGAFYVRAVGY